MSLLLRRLDEALSPLLATAAIGPLNAMLRRLSLVGRAALVQEHFGGRIIEDFFLNLCQADRLQLLARAIDDDWNDSLAGEVFTFVSLQSPKSIGELLKFLGMMHNLEARRVITNSLILLVGRRSEPFITALPTLNWRLAADAVYALARIGDPTAIDQMLGQYRREEHLMRVEVLNAVRPFQSPRIQDLMIEALNDDHEEVRLAALRYLAVYKIGEAVDSISNAISTRGFDKRAFDERRGWFITLGTIAGPAVFNDLRRRAEPGRGSSDAADGVHLALLGIRAIRTPEAVEYLVKFDQHAMGDLRLVTRKLLTRSRGA
jgi:hypothetical protein